MPLKCATCAMPRNQFCREILFLSTKNINEQQEKGFPFPGEIILVNNLRNKVIDL